MRTHSKTLSVANHVVWTDREVIPVTYALDGLCFDGAEWAVLQVPGSDLYCAGFRIDFRVPSGDANIRCSVDLLDPVGVSRGNLNLDGVVAGRVKEFSPPLELPANSAWRLRLNLELPSADESYVPQGVVATYYLRYAASKLPTLNRAGALVTGVGFEQIGTTFVVG